MDRLEAFLFIVLRDYMTIGQVEEIIQKHLKDNISFVINRVIECDDTRNYVRNDVLEPYIKDVVKRIQNG